MDMRIMPNLWNYRVAIQKELPINRELFTDLTIRILTHNIKKNAVLLLQHGSKHYFLINTEQLYKPLIISI
jgi:hypothetical protein